VEVQALIVKTQAPQPRRVVNGVDSSRVAMLLAVLERRANLPLSGFDVYVSTVGGVRVSEAGADLAIALAVGQISLAGEIRPASSGKQRLAEAKRLGFSQVLHSETVHLREALRLALAGASAERVDVPDF